MAGGLPNRQIRNPRQQPGHGSNLFYPRDGSGLYDSFNGSVCLLSVLGHPIRRKILELLTDRGETTRSEIAAQLADDSELLTTDPHHLEIIFHHNHLPTLDGNLFTEYDPRTVDQLCYR